MSVDPIASVWAIDGSRDRSSLLPQNCALTAWMEYPRWPLIVPRALNPPWTNSACALPSASPPILLVSNVRSPLTKTVRLVSRVAYRYFCMSPKNLPDPLVIPSPDVLMSEFVPSVVPLVSSRNSSR